MSKEKAIYIHIPFCKKKCIYCDFYSETDLEQIPAYLQGLIKEMGMRAEQAEKLNGCSKEEIDTIYFGGGTPSLLSAKEIEILLREISGNFSLSSDMEITLEVNPGTIKKDYLADLKSAGINRLSIGTQSFTQQKLSFLKRIHDVKYCFSAVDQAMNSGFDNISIDLIYGLPFENENMWLADLEIAMDIMPSHLSCYMLTIEPSTPLDAQVKKGRVKAAGEDTLSRLFKTTSRVLDKAGYEHYEISNFAKGSTNRSRHNSKYWDMVPYYGFGAAAHSYDGNRRSWNHRNINRYIEDIQSGRLPREESETLSSDQKMLEMIMLRLRTQEGLDLESFKTSFDISFEEKFHSIIEQVCSESLGAVGEKRFYLSLEGKTRLDSIIEALAQKIL